MSGYHLPHYFWDLLDWFLANHFLQALFAKLYYGQRLFLCSWAIVTGEHFITKWWHSVKYPGAWTNASTTSWQWVSWVHLAQQPPTDVNPKFVNGAMVAHVLTFFNTLGALLTKFPLKPQEGWWLGRNFSRHQWAGWAMTWSLCLAWMVPAAPPMLSTKAKSTAGVKLDTNAWGSGIHSVFPGVPADLPYDQNVSIHIPVPCFLLL